MPILDADVLAKDALAPGTIASKAILKRYGEKIKRDYQDKTIRIDRSKLSKIIFEDKNERIWLESIIHPIVKLRLNEEIKRHNEFPVLVMVIPLLFEKHLTNLCSEVWVVSCDEHQQYKRLMIRDNLSMNDAKKRIEAQWPLKEKRALAEVVIDNRGKSNVWQSQIETLL